MAIRSIVVLLVDLSVCCKGNMGLSPSQLVGSVSFIVFPNLPSNSRVSRKGKVTLPPPFGLHHSSAGLHAIWEVC
jgi:hypothetical protein